MSVFLTIFFMMIGSNARADNSARCYWYVGGVNQYVKRFFTSAPSPKTLYFAKIGDRMAYQSINLAAQSLNYVKCPGLTSINFTYTMDGELVDGFSDVYQTNIPGVGVRMKNPELNQSVPFSGSGRSCANCVVGLPNKFDVEYVRTGRDVKTGNVSLNFKVRAMFQDWDAAEISIIGTNELSSQTFFSGCSGSKTQDIPLGKVAIALLEQQTPRNVGLEILCTGVLPGTKLPLKVYFEGSNDGPGMLNLTPGGAEGIGISLTTASGVKLPFNKAGGLAMKWVKTEQDGELYSFDFDAKYARKGGVEPKPGRADAVLNYILDYN
ncbi:fimbrial protein [Pseudomonas sp. IAC-BECa141]|uniref:fimbrial protein n=1 Tax=Pseudomonas sp. IAC-BECa141 TaxID=2793103 RepID=UPI001D06B542|nr:fimbrial protein [Pseudomonas sp. IAC-BECa141]UDI94638.1 type 1 fimbrial protein [Pseudomonas sp. IAC-BECa141]